MVSINKMGIILGAFIVILLGVLLSSEISNLVTGTTTQASTVNDSITLLNGTAVSLTYDNLVSANITLLNGTTGSTIAASNYTVDISAGTVTLIYNTTGALGVNNSEALASYDYYPDTYVANRTARTLIALIIIFFAIAVMLYAFGGTRPLFEELMGGKL